VRSSSVIQEILEGFRHVAAHQIIMVLFVIIAVNQLFVFSLSTLIPAWSVSVLDGNATTNGFLFSARGIGSLVGALAIASLGRFTYRGRLLTFGAFLSAVLLVAFGFFRWLPASLIILAGIGVGTIFIMNLANAMIQTMTPERLRGRVMGAYTWIFFGFMPLGALWSGELAARVGLSEAVVIDGGLALCAATIVWMKFPRLLEQ
jgi:MFS family permease